MARGKAETTALPEGVDLGEYEGMPILACGLEMPGAAGGLRAALKIQPRLMHREEEYFLAFRVGPEKFRHDPIYVNGEMIGWNRVTIANVLGATFTSEQAVAGDLAETAERIQRAKEAERGVGRLPTPEELERQHELGEHADGLVENCPSCDDEDGAASAEAREAES